MNIDFYVHTYRDSPMKVVGDLKRTFPSSRVILISDGDGMEHDYKPFHLFADRLKDKGVQWIRRWFDLIRFYDSEIAVKVDPDSEIRRGFRKSFPSAPFFGSLVERNQPPTEPRFIHGGAQFLRREFVERIYGQLLDESFMDARFHYRGGILCADMVLAHLARVNKIRMADYSEVRDRGESFVDDGMYAITHPRKEWRN